MALLRVSWYRTEVFETEIEVDGYDPETTERDAEDGPIMSQLIDLSSEQIDKDFMGCTEREVTNVEVVREGDEHPEILAPRVQYQEDF